MKVNNRTRFGREIINKNKNEEKSNRFEKFEMLVHELETLSEKCFTGYVKVNYSQGSIGRVEKFEEILKEIKKRY